MLLWQVKIVKKWGSGTSNDHTCTARLTCKKDRIVEAKSRPIEKTGRAPLPTKSSLEFLQMREMRH